MFYSYSSVTGERVRERERVREGGRGWSGEMFPRCAMILQADSQDVSLVKNIIASELNYTG